MRSVVVLLQFLPLTACAEPCPDGEKFTPRGQQVAGYADCPDGQLLLCNAHTCAGVAGAYYCETEPDYLGRWIMWECRDCVIEWDDELAMEMTCPA